MTLQHRDNKFLTESGCIPNVSTLKDRANEVLMNEIDRNPEERIAMQMSIHSPELGLPCQ
jgi:hypothetical protein